MTDTRYFACVISKKYRENWEICKKIGSFGLPSRLKVLSEIRPGDKLLTYFGGSGFGAISTITSLVIEIDESSIDEMLGAHTWAHGTAYPYRFSFSIDHEYEFAVPYGGVPSLPAAKLQNGLLRLDESQYRYIMDTLENGQGDASLPPVQISATKSGNNVIKGVAKKIPLPAPPSGIVDQQGLVDSADVSASISPAIESSLHTKIQWQLVCLAEKVGCKVWIAKGDQGKTYNGKVLGEHPLVLSSLPPLGMPDKTRGIVERIDVLWIKNNAIHCAFEIEHTTAVYSGILRLSDLVAVQPYSPIRLFILAPEDRRSKVIQELNRPTFEALPQPLARVCQYIGYAKLEDYFEKFKDLPNNTLQIAILNGIAEKCDIP
jgi:hypothetical protein